MRSNPSTARSMEFWHCTLMTFFYVTLHRLSALSSEFLSFRDRICGLSRRFRFGSWDFGKPMKFFSTDTDENIENDLLTVSMKIKPLTIVKTRKTVVVNDICEEKEGRGLRQHISAGPRSRQQRVCFKSIPQSPWYPMVNDLNEANKVPRFRKEVRKRFELRFHQDAGKVSAARFSVYMHWCSLGSEARWFSHLCKQRGRDGQWKCDAHNSGFAFETADEVVTIFAECRGAAAVDELEWRKVFWATMVNPHAPIEKGEALRMSGGKSITGGMR